MRGLWPQPDTLRPLAYDFFRFLKRPQQRRSALGETLPYATTPFGIKMSI